MNPIFCTECEKLFVKPHKHDDHECNPIHEIQAVIHEQNSNNKLLLDIFTAIRKPQNSREIDQWRDNLNEPFAQFIEKDDGSHRLYSYAQLADFDEYQYLRNINKQLLRLNVGFIPTEKLFSLYNEMNIETLDRVFLLVFEHIEPPESYPLPHE